MALRKLRPAGFHFRRQVLISRFVVDFACLKQQLIVEVDGGQHGRDGQLERDRERDAALAACGLRVLRFWNAEIDRNLAGVMDTIYAALVGPADPTPVGFADSPSPPGREGAP